MKTITTHAAKTHLSKLLKEVQQGESYVILNGKQPVGKLTGVHVVKEKRPSVGTVTSGPVQYDADTFAPLSNEELKDWGLES